MAAKSTSKHPFQPGPLVRAEEQPGCPTHTLLSTLEVAALAVSVRDVVLYWAQPEQGEQMSVLAHSARASGLFSFLKFDEQEELPCKVLLWGSG